MNELMSPTAFKWFLTFLTGGLAGAWLVYDSINLIRARKLDRSDAVVRDKHFGYVMGIVIALVGVIGTLRFHDIV
jgi:hypothetical protein